MIKTKWLTEVLSKYFCVKELILSKEDEKIIIGKIEKELSLSKDKNGEFEKIVESVLDNNVRICSECKKIMTKGYVVYDGDSYYCSDNCLHKNWTEEEWEEMTSDDSDCYWTEWLEEKECI